MYKLSEVNKAIYSTLNTGERRTVDKMEAEVSGDVRLKKSFFYIYVRFCEGVNKCGSGRHFNNDKTCGDIDHCHVLRCYYLIVTIESHGSRFDPKRLTVYWGKEQVGVRDVYRGDQTQNHSGLGVKNTNHESTTLLLTALHACVCEGGCGADD